MPLSAPDQVSEAGEVSVTVPGKLMGRLVPESIAVLPFLVVITEE
jgi:hypothetical protein